MAMEVFDTRCEKCHMTGGANFGKCKCVPPRKSKQSLYAETLIEARNMTIAELREELKYRGALHGWAIDAYETALLEKLNKKMAKTS